jgi:CDGSH-type Zn-finger protein/uncharacterized membrane protein YkgB
MARLIRLEKAGPYRIDPADFPKEGKAMWICGCGLSGTMPYCDKSHNACKAEQPGVLYTYDAATRQVIDQRPESTPLTPPPPLDRVDRAISGRMASLGPSILRVGLALVFFWFGLLKALGVSPAADLVRRTVYGGIDPDFFVRFLGLWEVAIGLCLLDPGPRLGLGRWFTRLGVLLLLLQMPGTFLPLVILPDITWQRPFVPTLEGQYIFKNLVLIGAALVLGGRVRRDEQKLA